MVVDIPALSAVSALLCASYVSMSEPFVAKFAKCAHVLAATCGGLTVAASVTW